MRIHFISIATVTVMFFTVCPVSATAQTAISVGGGQMQMRLDAQDLSAIFGRAQDGSATAQVKIAPGDIVIDATTHTASIAIANSSADTLNVGLAFQNPPMEGTDSSSKFLSLASWMTGLPQSIRLLPHAKQELTIKATVPGSTTAGIYKGRLIATASTSGDEPPTFSTATITYEVK